MTMTSADVQDTQRPLKQHKNVSGHRFGCVQAQQDPLNASEGESAHWSAVVEGGRVCGAHMRELARQDDGARWCFHCRKRHPFHFVTYVPVGEAHYGPTHVIEGPKRGCNDLFPGTSRNFD